MVLDDQSASVLAAIEAGDTERVLREAERLAQRIRDLIAEGKLPDSDQGLINPDGTLDIFIWGVGRIGDATAPVGHSRTAM
jgi:hypothetical protein